MTLHILSSGTRKALAAVALIAGLGFAAPTQAADNVQFGFSFGNGSDFSFSVGNGGFNGRHFGPAVCMTKKQLRRDLRDRGFYQIDFGGERHGWIHGTARKNNRLFSFDVNSCNGDLANVAPVGPRWPGNFPSPGGHGGPGYPGSWN